MMDNRGLMNAVNEAICKNHRGKMEGMWSLSTSCRHNPYCLARMKNGNSICAACFSFRQTGYMKTLGEKLERNTELLTKQIIPVEAMPYIPLSIFRIESFGDLNDVPQLGNYFNLTNANPETMFALWTKNTFLFPKAREAGLVKPANLIIVESAPFIDTPIEPSDEWVDKVFIVWSKKYKDAPFINCGTKKCIECRNCYRKDGCKVINEIKK